MFSLPDNDLSDMVDTFSTLFDIRSRCLRGILYNSPTASDPESSNWMLVFHKFSGPSLSDSEYGYLTYQYGSLYVKSSHNRDYCK